MSSMAHRAPLFPRLQLLLDVLRGPLFAYAARGRLCERGQNTQVVLYFRLANAAANYTGLCIQ